MSGQLVYKGTATVRKTNVLDVTNVGASGVDIAANLAGMDVALQLISSTTVDESTNLGKTSKPAGLENWLLPSLLATDEVKYSVNFNVDKDFGLPGAFTIKNGHPNEFYLVSLSVEMPAGGKNSRVSLQFVDRIFFSNELCLPEDTPKGLVNARQTDLKALRGDGTGMQQDSDRIYDYDVYNDLSNQLLNINRPVLGGSQEYPYPRKIRTGRPVLNGAESTTLTPVTPYYVLSDERFGSVKNSDFLADQLKALSHSLLPALERFLTLDATFDSLEEVKNLYDQGMDLSGLVFQPIKGLLTPFELINRLSDTPGNNGFMKFPLPQVIQVNEKGWMSDEEFGRQMLAGVNPMTIEALKEFPPTSTLDPETYGPQKSTITEEQISKNIEGLTVQDALSKNKLFILNYHDTYMPYLNKINSQRDTYAYASRTLLFLTSGGTLKPVAIELSTPLSRRVFVPPAVGDIDWLWELAKAHVATNDSGYHQLVENTCIYRAFIIATNRQLSNLHPLNGFLQPHFKNTMSINARARQSLINAGGIIERTFSTGIYSMEMSSIVYKSWRFDEQGLPADLLKRGMAVADSSAKHGMKLVVEDYPYAADGLEVWGAIEKWTSDYLDACYKEDKSVVNDTELQAWWTEIINEGHEDKKNEKWWIRLDSKKNLTLVLATLIWLASAHHGAVNFGQFAYAGYMPNRPTATHKPIPERESEEHKQMLANPEEFFLASVSRKLEAIVVMLTIEIYATDEEYLGQRVITNWTNNAQAKSAFSAFSESLKQVEELVTARNKDSKLKNRTGVVSVPYTLLYPSSGDGITGKGVPNSISI